MTVRPQPPRVYCSLGRATRAMAHCLPSGARIRYDQRAKHVAADLQYRPFHPGGRRLPHGAPRRGHRATRRRAPLPRFAAPPAVQSRRARAPTIERRHCLHLARRIARRPAPSARRAGAVAQQRLASGRVPRLRRFHGDTGIPFRSRRAGATGTLASDRLHVRRAALVDVPSPADLRLPHRSRLVGDPPLRHRPTPPAPAHGICARGRWRTDLPRASLERPPRLCASAVRISFRTPLVRWTPLTQLRNCPYGELRFATGEAIMARRIGALIAGFGMLACASSARAVFHVSDIDEVLTSYGGDPNIQ